MISFTPSYKEISISDGPPDDAIEYAKRGLQHAADKQGLSLHTVDVHELARVALTAALKSGHLVTRDNVEEWWKRHRIETDRISQARWTVVGKYEQALVKWQRILTVLAETDRRLAERLAHDVGVMLLPDTENG